ncbi:MAG: cytochrome C biogenesis protein CcdA [Armatimonadetes bacterium JP3_11]|jgi:periplasmic divalent cation tolerance protein|nr:MAG: cytochrome C biogenesis protein CcdA [Armatimonadetes bacterium CP1_7O]OYT75608.1 MAG: cytochrome C biogenesis protein CcdA [Armatimonadetes bacterium JP3_11]RMH08225.1 MAG: divalent-cation tolerance protein CutA [Armatimonadota bacterium]
MPPEPVALYYLTFSTLEEAQRVAYDLLRERIAVCTNWFPITCAYLWEGEIQQESEIVLIVKARAGARAQIEQVVRRHISYTQFIGELPLASVNAGFAEWLARELSD